MSGILPAEFSLRLIATDLTVRETLSVLRARFVAQNVPEDVCGSVELVLAEALNNIVEHAYPPDRPGDVLLALSLTADRLRCTLRDRGVPLAGLTLPDGGRPDPEVARDALPEGGFGWYLIRDLSDHLSYARTAEENVLTLDFILVRGGDPAAAQMPKSDRNPI